MAKRITQLEDASRDLRNENTLLRVTHEENKTLLKHQIQQLQTNLTEEKEGRRQMQKRLSEVVPPSPSSQLSPSPLSPSPPFNDTCQCVVIFLGTCYTNSPYIVTSEGFDQTVQPTMYTIQADDTSNH